MVGSVADSVAAMLQLLFEFCKSKVTKSTDFGAVFAKSTEKLSRF